MTGIIKLNGDATFDWEIMIFSKIKEGTVDNKKKVNQEHIFLIDSSVVS